MDDWLYFSSYLGGQPWEKQQSAAVPLVQAFSLNFFSQNLGEKKHASWVFLEEHHRFPHVSPSERQSHRNCSIFPKKNREVA